MIDEEQLMERHGLVLVSSSSRLLYGPGLDPEATTKSSSGSDSSLILSPTIQAATAVAAAAALQLSPATETPLPQQQLNFQNGMGLSALQVPHPMKSTHQLHSPRHPLPDSCFSSSSAANSSPGLVSSMDKATSSSGTLLTEIEVLPQFEDLKVPSIAESTFNSSKVPKENNAPVLVPGESASLNSAAPASFQLPQLPSGTSATSAAASASPPVAWFSADDEIAKIRYIIIQVGFPDAIINTDERPI
jgi:hypothetical protein